MFTIPNFYLTDSSGQVWQLGATGLEAYTTTPVSGPTGLPNFVLVDLVTGVFWSMTVLTTGTLEIDETALAGRPRNGPAVCVREPAAGSPEPGPRCGRAQPERVGRRVRGPRDAALARARGMARAR